MFLFSRQPASCTEFHKKETPVCVPHLTDQCLLVFFLQFKRSGKKPSEFCKTNLRMHDVKSYDFVKQSFSNPQLLVKAIKEYRRTANIPKGEYSLSDLLR